jgi:hypothetical protein
MPPGRTDTRVEIHDPALEGGEWLFRRSGQVFGPVSSRDLAVMLYRGELDGATPVSAGEGRWTPVGEVPIFRVHAKKAEAALRVDKEITSQRLLAERRGRIRATALVLGLLLVVGGAITGTWWLVRGPSIADDPELQGFGEGVSIVRKAQVGAGRRAAEDEVEVAIEPDAAPGARGGLQGAGRRSGGAAAPGPARPPPSGEAAGGDLSVRASWNEANIQQVIAREQRTFAPCLREEAQRSPEWRGQIPIEFAIGNDGRVVRLWIDEPRFKAGRLHDCLVAALGTWRFAPFPGQQPTVTMTLGIGP